MSDLTAMTAAELSDALASGRVSSEEATTACLERIDASEPVVRAFLAVDAEGALDAARDIDRRRSRGERIGRLAGVPVAVKDNFCYRRMPTTCGSAMLDGWRSPYDATVVARLLAEGMVVVGKTNMDEFAMGSSTENSAFGPTRNPWDLDRVPGGSGGGSAAAVAASQVPLAVGSDTGGSIRQPASLTGTVGVKPTYGGASRYGNVALASSLDVPGPCARTVLDAAMLHEVIGGHDPLDSTSARAPVPPVVAAARDADVRGMRVGVVSELGGEGYEPGVLERVAEAVEALAGLGAIVEEVSCPSFEYALAAYYLILPAEVSSNLARFDAMRYGARVGDDGVRDVEAVTARSRGAGFGAETKRRVILGTYALSRGYYDAHYGSAQKVRTLIIRDFDAAFARFDALVGPSVPTVAFRIGERIDDQLAMYAQDLCTIPSSMAGNASASFPVGLADGLPVGAQVIAPPMADDRVYRVGAALERALAPRWAGARLDPRLENARGQA